MVNGLDVLVCNLGEIAQLVTGGYLWATSHRVMIHPTSTSYNRTSIPFLYNPKLDCVVNENIISFQQHDNTATTNRMVVTNHSLQTQSTGTNLILPQYGDNAFKSLARSHPAVFIKHNPDLKLLENGQVVYK